MIFFAIFNEINNSILKLAQWVSTADFLPIFCNLIAINTVGLFDLIDTARCLKMQMLLWTIGAPYKCPIDFISKWSDN